MPDSERYLVVCILVTVSALVGWRGYRAYRTNIFGGRSRATRGENPKSFWAQVIACLIFSVYTLWFALWLVAPATISHPPLLKQYVGQALD